MKTNYTENYIENYIDIILKALLFHPINPIWLSSYAYQWILNLNSYVQCKKNLN